MAVSGTYSFSIGTSGLFGSVFSVSPATPGSLIRVPRGGNIASASISGVSLDELAASLEAARISTASKRTPITIGGESGYLYGVSQASMVRPLASIAIAIHEGVAYAFMEHLFLDAPASGDFRTFLLGVSFT